MRAKTFLKDIVPEFKKQLLNHLQNPLIAEKPKIEKFAPHQPEKMLLEGIERDVRVGFEKERQKK